MSCFKKRLLGDTERPGAVPKREGIVISRNRYIIGYPKVKDENGFLTRIPWAAGTVVSKGSGRGPSGWRFYPVMPPKHMYLISRNSSIPYLEPSRPRPDSFTPPKGATSVEMLPVLMPTIPYSS